MAWITPVTSPKATILAVDLYGTAIIFDEFGSGVGVAALRLLRG